MEEEELLGFHVFVAELELLVSKHRVLKEGCFCLVYSGALVEVLQKLVVSLDHTSTEVLKSCQGRCEQVLNGVLMKGACPEVRDPRFPLLKLDCSWHVKCQSCRKPQETWIGCV